jgi:hypothetical protein
MVDVTVNPISDTGSRTEDGDAGSQIYDVVASSGPDALAKLLADKAVGYGQPARDLRGNLVGGDTVYLALEWRQKSPTTMTKDGLWEITARYGVPTSQFGGGATPEPNKPVYQWHRNEESIEVERDRAGNMLANTRGEPFDPRHTMYLPSRALTIKWVIAANELNLANLFAYDGAVNSDTWLIRNQWSVTAGLALCLGIDPEERGTTQILLTGHFRFRPNAEPWKPYKTPSYTVDGGVRKYLDASGAIVDEASAHVHEFDLNPSAAFSALGV